MANLLRDTNLRNARPKKRKYSLCESGNLQIIIDPNGSKYWVVRYRFDPSAPEKELRVGKYPAATIAEARGERNRIHELVSEGIDPRIFGDRPRAGS